MLAIGGAAMGVRAMLNGKDSQNLKETWRVASSLWAHCF